ncbi:hypothetical protein LX36DRAFT_391260 [Colletotrichum falcatum]|nr:hypothetical protein LX36DRAFT_391260 [Colletotrichum falcatum]
MLRIHHLATTRFTATMCAGSVSVQLVGSRPTLSTARSLVIHCVEAFWGWRPPLPRNASPETFRMLLGVGRYSVKDTVYCSISASFPQN